MKKTLLGMLLLQLWLPAALQAGPGAAYGRNIFTGAFVGGVLGATAGLLPYALERQSQDPSQIAFTATYGAVGTAVILAPLLSAYEVNAGKSGAGNTVLFSTFGFAALGAVSGAGWSMMDYQTQIGTPREKDGEVILWNAAFGALGGGALGLVTGLWEILVWRQPDGLIRPPGSGIHADLQFLEVGSILSGPRESRMLPHIKAVKWTF